MARRTGLKPDVIRAWERRYGAIEPARTSTNRRYYTDEQIERLVLLRQATLAGRQIGQISDLTTDELKQLVASDEEAIARAPRAVKPPPAREMDGATHFASCLSAIENLDAQELHFHLERCAVEMSQQQIIELVLVPLLERMGSMWEAGLLRVAHEHMASSVIGAFLSGMQSSIPTSDNAPSILVGTPSRQLHEMGALIAAATAASEGWRVTYVGANLPAEEIAAAVHQKGASVLALSIVYPTDDPKLERELLRLRRLLGDRPTVLVGGRSARAYSRALRTISAISVDRLDQLRSALRESRT